MGEALVDTTDCIIWALDLDQEDWLLESWFRGKLASVEHTAGCWDDLTTTSVDSISMESNIMDVETRSTHVLFGHDTFFGCPLESSFDRVLNFIEELNSLGDVNDNIGTSGLGSEAPDLHGIIRVP